MNSKSLAEFVEWWEAAEFFQQRMPAEGGKCDSEVEAELIRLLLKTAPLMIERISQIEKGYALKEGIEAAPQAEQQNPEFGAPYQGAREEMAIWKKRALEAEARIRDQDQIIDRLGQALNADNGPVRFGEPVLPQAEQAVAIYQIWRSTDSCQEFYSWEDVEKEEFDCSAAHPSAKRILYTAAPAPDVSGLVAVPKRALCDFIEYSIHGPYGADDKWLADKNTLVFAAHQNREG